MRISTHEELLGLLDDIVARSARGDRSAPSSAAWWTELLTREGHPLTTRLPDECLVDWHARGLLGELDGARVLDVGCGNGRNTAWFAAQGAEAIGIDLAGDLLDAVRPTLPGVTLTCTDVLRGTLPDGPFDVVYDSGCYHHLAPHRRATYRERVLPLVGSRYCIVTFAAEVADQPDDAAVLLSGDTAGGLAFTLDDLRRAFAPLAPVELRRMRTGVEGAFGEDFLDAGLFAVDGRAPQPTR